MLIRDLEFINLSDAGSSSSAVKGGAFAGSFAVVEIGKDDIKADAGAVAVGEQTKAITGTQTTLITNKYYTAGYGLAKGIATARDGSDYKYSIKYDTKVI